MPLYAASQPWRLGRPFFPLTWESQTLHDSENRAILREFAQGASI